MWVQPESEVKEEEEGGKSSNGESFTSRRSPLSAVSSGRRMQEEEVPVHLRGPRRYGDRATKVHFRFNERTGLGEVVDGEKGDQMLTGGGM